MGIKKIQDNNQDKLLLVNRCLVGLGEAPLPEGTITSEFPLGSDIQVISEIVDETMVEVLNRGWWFNTMFKLTLLPDVNGMITIPNTVLRLDTGKGLDYIIRDGSLFDMRNKTFKIDTSIVADVISVVDYSTLPISAYEYVANRASRKAYAKLIGATQELENLKQEEMDASVSLQRESLQYVDGSLLNIDMNRSY